MVINANVNLCALEMIMDVIIFGIFSSFVRIKTWFSKIHNGMLSFCWRKSNSFFSQWGSWIETLYEKGEIIASEV